MFLVTQIEKIISDHGEWVYGQTEKYVLCEFSIVCVKRKLQGPTGYSIT